MMPSLPSDLPVSAPASTTPTAGAGAELISTDGRALPLLATSVRATAAGGLAQVVIEQRFANPDAEAVHVHYRMPLPADGAVSGYQFELDGRTITGQVDRKAEARARFERAVAAGHTAALLEQQRADIFTQELGNVPGRTELVARIRVDVRLTWLPEGEWELRVPTVIGPRYLSASDDAQVAADTRIQVAHGDTGVRLQLHLTVGDAITGGAAPNSPTHQLVADGAGYALRAPSRLDRDLVVRWRVAGPTVGLGLRQARRGDDAGAVGLLTVVPPAPNARAAVTPRDLIVLLDTSGSMDGGPLTCAKQVVGLLVSALTEQDRLELIEFSDAPRRWKAEPVRASDDHKAAAQQWVRTRVASGGTEMRAGVREALESLRLGAQRQIVVVTDGYIGGEESILAELHAHLPASCRLHVLGVGAAVNRALAAALARAGRGVEVLVGVGEDAERGARRLLDRTAAPMLTNLEIEGSAVRGVAPEHLPDVFAGAPLLAALELAPGGGELVVRGQTADGPWQQVLTVAPTAAGAGDAAVLALYARERVADLEARAPIAGAASEIETQISYLGLHYQIATRFTSWIAVDDSRVHARGSHTHIVPQELPYGTRAEALGLRAAVATSGPGLSTLWSMAMPAPAAPAAAKVMSMAMPPPAPRSPARPGAAPPAPAEDEGSRSQTRTRAGVVSPEQAEEARARLEALAAKVTADLSRAVASAPAGPLASAAAPPTGVASPAPLDPATSTGSLAPTQGTLVLTPAPAPVDRPDHAVAPGERPGPRPSLWWIAAVILALLALAVLSWWLTR